MTAASLTFANPREAYEAGYALLDADAAPAIEFRHAVPRTRTGAVYVLPEMPESTVDIFWAGTAERVTGAPLADVQAAAASTRPL